MHRSTGKSAVVPAASLSKQRQQKPGGGGGAYSFRQPSASLFTCPLCLAPQMLVVKLATVRGRGEAILNCLECQRRRGGPSIPMAPVGGIAYPYKLGFMLKLERKVDVFCKFRELVQASHVGGVLAVSSTSAAASTIATPTPLQNQVSGSGGSGAENGGGLLGGFFAASSASGTSSALKEEEEEEDELGSLFGSDEEEGEPMDESEGIGATAAPEGSGVRVKQEEGATTVEAGRTVKQQPIDTSVLSRKRAREEGDDRVANSQSVEEEEDGDDLDSLFSESSESAE